MKSLLLKNKTAEVLVDDEVYEKMSKSGWWLNSYGYAVRQLKVNGKRKNICLHHLVLEKKIGFDIDHINRNKLDNRKSNLRYVTRAQNIYNMSEKSNNTSGKRGVSWNEKRKTWRAYIGGSKSRKELGSFKTKEMAIIARQRAEKEFIE